MKKIEIRIKNAKKKLEKLSKNNYYESNDLQSLANSLDTKVIETLKGIAEISELKTSLENKKQKLNESKSEIKKLIAELDELSYKKSKEQAKKKDDEKKKINTKENLEKAKSEKQTKK